MGPDGNLEVGQEETVLPINNNIVSLTYKEDNPSEIEVEIQPLVKDDEIVIEDSEGIICEYTVIEGDIVPCTLTKTLFNERYFVYVNGVEVTRPCSFLDFEYCFLNNYVPDFDL